MNAKNKMGFTHLAKIYGIPCYFNENTMEVKGTNKVYDLLIGARIMIEQYLPLDNGFYITKIRTL